MMMVMMVILSTGAVIGDNNHDDGDVDDDFDNGTEMQGHILGENDFDLEDDDINIDVDDIDELPDPVSPEPRNLAKVVTSNSWRRKWYYCHHLYQCYHDCCHHCYHNCYHHYHHHYLSSFLPKKNLLCTSPSLV